MAKVSKGRMQQHVDDNVSSHLSLVASKQAEMMEEIESLKKVTLWSSLVKLDRYD